MASAAPGGGARGRRKQAKPQRKVELEDNNGVQYNTVLTEIAATASSMCPDTNHNEIQIDDVDDMLKEVSNTKGAAPQHAAHPDRSAKTGGTAEDIENVAAEAAVADTTNYPETVPSLTNGVKSEGDDATNAAAAEYLIKCPHCQRGCQSFQALKEHMGAEHPDLCTEGGGGGAAATLAAPGGALSPAPSTGGPYGCSQCTASFTSKDQLEKHELLHSPNAQVSCKVCNKTFANVYRLQRHMISHDESAVLRKFKCTECDKAFKFKHHLKEHIRIHSGEKPFECVNCGKRFSHSGSYSSHMTSKKCLVMNLKLGRTRAPNAAAANAMLDKAQPQQQQQQSARGAKRPSNPLNNNITTTNHNAAYLPILPKYTEAAAAFIQNSLAGNPAMHSLYTHGMLNTNMHPYGVPSISHLLQQLHGGGGEKPHDYEPKVEPHELNKSCGSSCGDLVMDEGEEGKCSDVEEKEEARSPSPPSSVGGGNNNGDFEAVKRILETVNASVTKQFLQANMQKFSTENSMDCASPPRSPSPPVNCLACKKSFGTQAAFDEHDCEQNDLKSEGLAAKLEDAVASKSENEMNASGNEDEYEKGDRHEEYDKSDRAEDYEMDSESVTTTDQLTEDGRKVRVRSLISDEQLKILKDNYALNPRPKKDELTKIAEQIGFPVRVVQVWFQNTRARDRREGRLIQNSYPPPAMLPPFPIVAPVPVPSNPHYSNSKYVEYGAEQPLDLSIKKEHSRESSPASSPRRPASSNHHHSDSGDEVVNLSYKSSRSPTPLQYTPSYHHNYQESNCSSEPRISPSPLECSRLAQILATPKIHGMGLIQFGQHHHHHHPDLNSLTQFIQNRMSTLSPNSDKRSWDNGDAIDDDHAETPASKRGKVATNAAAHNLMKGFASPMLGNNGQELEIEGQFTCDQCDKAFSKQSSLARHKYEHSGQRPHKCDECPKAFKHKHHLTEHKRLHSGEKPFQCGKCLKRFSHSGSYSQHMNHRYSYCKPYRE